MPHRVEGRSTGEIVVFDENGPQFEDSESAEGAEGARDGANPASHMRYKNLKPFWIAGIVFSLPAMPLSWRRYHMAEERLPISPRSRVARLGSFV